MTDISLFHNYKMVSQKWFNHLVGKKNKYIELIYDFALKISKHVDWKSYITSPVVWVWYNDTLTDGRQNNGWYQIKIASENARAGRNLLSTYALSINPEHKKIKIDSDKDNLMHQFIYNKLQPTVHRKVTIGDSTWSL